MKFQLNMAMASKYAFKFLRFYTNLFASKIYNSVPENRNPIFIAEKSDNLNAHFLLLGSRTDNGKCKETFRE